MELTSKQRAALSAQANGIETIMQVGKGGVGDALIKQIDEALTARELIKLRVLESSPGLPREIADELAGHTGASVVRTIGSKIILFRRNEKEPKIKL